MCGSVGAPIFPKLHALGKCAGQRGDTSTRWILIFMVAVAARRTSWTAVPALVPYAPISYTSTKGHDIIEMHWPTGEAFTNDWNSQAAFLQLAGNHMSGVSLPDTMWSLHAPWFSSLFGKPPLMADKLQCIQTRWQSKGGVTHVSHCRLGSQFGQMRKENQRSCRESAETSDYLLPHRLQFAKLMTLITGFTCSGLSQCPPLLTNAAFSGVCTQAGRHSETMQLLNWKARWNGDRVLATESWPVSKSAFADNLWQAACPEWTIDGEHCFFASITAHVPIVLILAAHTGWVAQCHESGRHESQFWKQGNK